MILSRGTAQEPPWVWPEPSFAILSLVRLAFRVLPSTSSFPQGITSVWPSCGHCEGQRLKNEVHRVYAFLNGVGTRDITFLPSGQLLESPCFRCHRMGGCSSLVTFPVALVTPSLLGTQSSFLS